MRKVKATRKWVRLHRQTNHHRKPRSRGGANTGSNIIRVPELSHRAWHYLFSNCSAQEIAHIINETWLDLDFVFICKERRKS